MQCKLGWCWNAIANYHISSIRSRGYYLFQALTRCLYKGGDYDSQLESCIIASLLPRSHDNGHQLELARALYFMAPILEARLLNEGGF